MQYPTFLSTWIFCIFGEKKRRKTHEDSLIKAIRIFDLYLQQTQHCTILALSIQHTYDPSHRWLAVLGLRVCVRVLPDCL